MTLASILQKGLVQVYTGEGKGKTTAAFGSAWRMMEAGGRVCICQFLKPPRPPRPPGVEAALAEWFGHRLTLERIDEEWDMRSAFSDPRQIERMREAIVKKLEQIKQWAKEGKYDMIVLDEIVFCLSKALVRWEDVAAIIETRAGHVELVLTGRGADERLIKKADLVTEMNEIKHPYRNGFAARKGIEY